MLIWYRNSFLASVVSIFGCILTVAGIASFSEEVAPAVIMLLGGIALLIWGKQISKNKAFKTWWKQIEDNNLQSAIAVDLNTAIVIYQKNPQKKTIAKIAELNPHFAEHIEKNIANKK